MNLIDEYRNNTLFSRTTLTITLVTSAFLLFTRTILALFIMEPTTQRSAHEMASLVLLSAEAVHRVDPAKSEQFKQHLTRTYELAPSPLSPLQTIFPPTDAMLPFFYSSRMLSSTTLAIRLTSCKTTIRARRIATGLE